MTTISLPSHAYEVDLPALLDCLGTGDLADEIMLDFSPVTFWTPGALVSLLAKVHCWDRQNKVVGFENYDKCPAFRYLQRINFFSIFGVRMSENFRRHDPGSRFVELRRIGGEGAVDIAELSTDIAYCISPDADFEDPEQSGLFDLIEYSVSELASNVVQHARASGFATAQYMPRTDLVRVAIADYGIGILRSFVENGSPLCEPDWTDADAIAAALRPKVSSKSHLSSPWGEAVNAGVGLTLLKELCLKTEGQFVLASGRSVLLQRAGWQEPEWRTLRNGFQGTLCVLVFARAKVRSFAELLHNVKGVVGLLPGGNEFGKLFT